MGSSRLLSPIHDVLVSRFHVVHDWQRLFEPGRRRLFLENADVPNHRPHLQPRQSER